MQPITIQAGYKRAVVSEWNSTDGIRYIVSGVNGGRTRYFKTLAGAVTFARRYVA